MKPVITNNSSVKSKTWKEAGILTMVLSTSLYLIFRIVFSDFERTAADEWALFGRILLACTIMVGSFLLLMLGINFLIYRHAKRKHQRVSFHSTGSSMPLSPVFRAPGDNQAA